MKCLTLFMCSHRFKNGTTPPSILVPILYNVCDLAYLRNIMGGMYSNLAITLDMCIKHYL